LRLSDNVKYYFRQRITYWELLGETKG